MDTECKRYGIRQFHCMDVVHCVSGLTVAMKFLAIVILCIESCADSRYEIIIILRDNLKFFSIKVRYQSSIIEFLS